MTSCAGDDGAVRRLLDAAADTVPGSAFPLVGVLRDLLGAQATRLYVADYSLRHLQQMNDDGVFGAPVPIAGTLAGRAFTSGEVVVSSSDPTVLSVPLLDGTRGIGLLELDFDVFSPGVLDSIATLTEVFVLLLVSSGRYSDQWLRARRSEPLSPAAEIQWDILPPLSCSTPDVEIGAVLEPAYSIGGDSFDYAFNGRSLDFAIVDATGHGMSAVLMATAAVNCLRHSRRRGSTLQDSFHRADELISTQFGDCYYVTAQLASLDVPTGILTWINAGHMPPMLVRDGTYLGELSCRPSRPLGLNGPLQEVATQQLQRGDRVLLYTDGITESRSPQGAVFGQDRLADFLVRAALEQVPVAETARRLAMNVVDHVGSGLRDDATLLLIEFGGRATRQAIAEADAAQRSIGRHLP